jgi:hypothetical protein
VTASPPALAPADPARTDPRGGPPRPESVPILRLAPADSPRLLGEDAEHVRMLADAGTDLPPILVHRRTPRVIDGMHRLRAAHLRGDTHIAVLSLRTLAKDPSLRMTDAGRELLRALSVPAVDAGDRPELVSAVPSHCADRVGLLAAAYAAAWADLAERMRERARAGRSTVIVGDRPTARTRRAAARPTPTSARQSPRCPWTGPRAVRDAPPDPNTRPRSGAWRR